MLLSARMFLQKPSNESAERRAPGGARTIPSLDGLRAVAVTTVILSHFNGWVAWAEPRWVRSGLLVLGQGGLGVSAFFIISGFLITTLLLEERERAGGVDLKRFYFRRTLRIFPAFYAYLLTAALVAQIAGRAIPTGALMAAATYVSDYVPYVWAHPLMQTWYVAHLWSLSVEEQFYLFWPVLLVRLSPRRAVQTCVAVVCVVPLLRVLTVEFLPVYATVDQWYRLFHTNADVLALGCLMAFALRRPDGARKLARWFHPAVLAGCALYLAVCSFLSVHAPPWLTALVVITAANGCLALLIVFFVLRPGTIFGKVLNWRPMRHVGVISYSLYLWQQLFLGPYNVPSRLRNLVAVFLCAELSFWLVETPFLRLRRWLEGRWFGAAATLEASPLERS